METPLGIFLTDKGIEEYQRLSASKIKKKTQTGRTGKADPFFSEVQKISVSPRLINLSIVITAYRRTNCLSQQDMAELCSQLGKRDNITFTQVDISAYELMKRAPSKPKFQILCKEMGITPECLK